MPDYDYIASRLRRMADEALLKAQKATLRVGGEATLHGAYGGSRMHIHVHETIVSTLKEAMVQMATFTYTALGETSVKAGVALEGAGFKFVDEAVQWLRNKYESKTTKAFGGYLGPSLPELEQRLRDVVQNAVEDFRHGIAGEAALKKDPLVNIVSKIANSPGAVVQTALGDNNEQTVQQRASGILQAIDEMLASEEFKSLDGPKGSAIEDAVDVVRGEIKKPDADQSKITRWTRRLLEMTKEFGMHVAAAALAKALLGP